MQAEHTDKKYEEDLKKLREEILYMGGLVEDQIQKAVKSLVDRDSELAQIIIERDHEVNRLDVEIDENIFCAAATKGDRLKNYHGSRAHRRHGC